MRVETMSMSVLFFTAVRARTGEGFLRCFSVIREPSDCMLYEFFTRTGTPALRQGAMERGCKICAPKYASSAASS